MSKAEVPQKSPSGSPYHLIKKPTDHPEEHLRVLAKTDFCVVAFSEYFKLSKQNEALQASLKEYSKQLKSAIKRTHSSQRSLMRLNAGFQTLVTLRDDTLFRNLRCLENSVTETIRLIESIQTDFNDGQMGPDDFSAALSMILAVLDDAEPDYGIASLFDEK